MVAAEELLGRFASGELQFKKRNEICRLLGVSSRGGRDALFRLLDEAEAEGKLARDERGRLATPERLGLVTGTVQGSGRGFGFLLREGGPDLFLPPRALHGALHGDTVLARVVGGERGDEAAVYSVVRRGMRRVAGTYYRDGRGGVVEPDERRLGGEIRVRGGVRAASGEKVLVRIDAWPDGRSPEGTVEEVLGRSGDLAAEEEAILRAHGLREEFPPAALREAEKAAAEPVSVRSRRDFRGECVITIDGDHSRDFDDAVTLTREGGVYRLGVHIADVSHYVKRGGEADKEAYARGTSVYFPDRVLPMLPECLSNGACSLNEGEDRYTLSCVMAVDGKGRVTDRTIVRGVIRSSARMTYGDVNAILAGDEALRKRYAPLVPMLEQMRDLAADLRGKRDARGGVDLDLPEAEISVQGDAIEVRARERGVSERIIEEFMILANETVAEFVAGFELPFMYRVHEKPSEEKASAFLEYLKGMGVQARFRPENVRPRDYAAVLDSLEGSPLRAVVNGVMLRSMSKAKYSAENGGHFGLASACYCHFTSPIRRYPDLIVHRVLGCILDGEAERAQKSFASFVQNAAVACSECERRADEAERDVDELYKVWSMRGHVGERFEGVVSGVTSFGLFVELENTVEGRVRVESLPEDEYTYVEERALLQGKRRAYRLGERMEIVVAACDIGARRCEFLPADGAGAPRASEKQAPARRAAKKGTGRPSAASRGAGKEARKGGKSAGKKGGGRAPARRRPGGRRKK